MPKQAMESDESTASESSYLRRSKPVRVRRNPWKESGRWLIRAALISGVAMTGGISVAFSVDAYLREAPTFHMTEENPGRVSGLRYTRRAAIEAILARGAARSIYDFPMEERRRRIKELPWVKHAVLRRNWPNRVWVRVEERAPVAFVRLPLSRDKGRGESPKLIDAEGVFLDSPEGNRFVFPVLTGIDRSMPQEDRIQRLKLYQALLSGLDASEPFYSSRVSEIDVADARNAKVSTAFDGEMIELQMGEKNFRHRFEVFLENFRKWKKEFGRVKSVDLRYQGVVVTE